MVEIFQSVPDHIKTLAKLWVDLALQQENILDGINMIIEFMKSCDNEEEKEYIDFYFKLRLEQLQNESNSNFS